MNRINRKSIVTQCMNPMLIHNKYHRHYVNASDFRGGGKIGAEEVQRCIALLQLSDKDGSCCRQQGREHSIIIECSHEGDNVALLKETAAEKPQWEAPLRETTEALVFEGRVSR